MVILERVSFEPGHPLWYARAQRDGKTWNGLGEGLEESLIKLEKKLPQAVEQDQLKAS